ncbi:hypothetical protein JCM21900_006986 [Sporobolomyces salmonicolor]
MANPEDVVWALHTFEAENEDELAFEAGERIVVLERDDQYGDGWFQGRNPRGEQGLFPQSYTSPYPPAIDENGGKYGDDGEPAEGGATLSPPTPLAASSSRERLVASDLHQSLDRLSPRGSFTTGGSGPGARTPSINSSRRSSGASAQMNDDDEDSTSMLRGTSGVGAAHRAALAQKALENAEQAAREQRERAERRRREDEEAYERARNQGLIEGLQLSDESDDEDDMGPSIGAFHIINGAAAAAAAAENHPNSSQTTSLSSSLGTELNASRRPRADTQPSIYAESTYSTYSTNSSIPPVPSAALAPADIPAPLSRSPSRSSSRSPVVTASSASPTPDQQQHHTVLDSLKSTTGAAADTVGAGTVGAAAAAASLNLENEQQDRTTTPEPIRSVTPSTMLLSEAAPVVQTSTPALPEPLGALPATTFIAPGGLDSVGPPTPLPLPAASAAAPKTPKHAPTPLPLSTSFSSVAASSSPAASHTSGLTQSRASSRMGTAGTGETSPGPSVNGAGPEKDGRVLPKDPLSWTVDDVVEWGRQKGFDALTLTKFAEHEISGDVLLEMDVVMLKEIDLVAFGRRVHIYNAIKELKSRRSMQSSVSSAGMLSPMSGYEPDSPGTTGSTGAFQSPQMSWDQPLEKVSGLGFDEDSAGGSSVRAPSSLGQRSVSNLRSARSVPSQMDSTATSASIRKRSITVDDTLGSFDEPRPIAEEATDAGESTTTDTGKPRSSTGSGALSLSLPKSKSRQDASKPKLARRSTTKSDTGSATSAPSSPNPSTNGQARKSSKMERGERERSFLGSVGAVGGAVGGLMGRTRKPPPRVPSALLLDSPAKVPAVRPRSTLQDRAKRSTRLFGSFGNLSGSDKSTPSAESLKTKPSLLTPSSVREAPSSMSLKVVDPAGKEMIREEMAVVKDGNLMDKIGRPDHSGWMRKKGEKYNTWKQRFFVLKGTYLYYLKSEQEQRAKGVINLSGYRVISDANIHPGEFGFKIVHDKDRAHYFSAAEQITVRAWMKEIMKATILRDYAAQVMSSCDIDVLPLSVAQTMTPRPRPPSPTMRAQIQKERYGGASPSTLTQKDAAILMDFAPGSPLMSGDAPWSTTSPKRPASTASDPRQSAAAVVKSPRVNQLSELQEERAARSVDAPKETTALAPAAVINGSNATSNAELLGWVNSNLPSTCPLATDLALSLRSGRLLVRLLENLTGKDSHISDQDFDKFHQREGETFDTEYLDTIFSVFDYMSPLISTDDISMEDVITGDEPHLRMLLERMRTAYPTSAAAVADSF